MTHLEYALSQVGVSEIVGGKDNPKILAYFDEIGFDGAKLKDETSWCSAFINWAAKKAGKPYSGKLDARSWLKVGEEVKDSCQFVGDIVIFWRESKDSWKGHVGIYCNEIGDDIYVLGGNQSNKVCIQVYPKSRLLGYRRL